jgi:hypothetical protein
VKVVAGQDEDTLNRLVTLHGSIVAAAFTRRRPSRSPRPRRSSRTPSAT